jgi:hypothetical protein
MILIVAAAFLALFLMYHENVWSIVIIFALLAYAARRLVYAGSKKSVTGITAAWIGVGLLILLIAWQLLGPRLANPGNWNLDPWQTINQSLTGV